MANKAAGEIDITLDGKEYLLRPSFNAVIEFEDKAGMSVFEAMRAIGEKQSMPLKTVTAAFHSCIKAAWRPSMGKVPTFEEIGMAIRKEGMPAVAGPYTTLLGNMLTGERAMEQATRDVDAGKA